MAANQVPNGIVHEASSVSRWYDNRSVFITGGSGFMGKVLIERLLSTCSGIDQVFVLLRRKKDISPETRLEQLKQTPIFDSLRKHYPQRLEKLVPITGDILLPELGISPEEQRILTASVSVVFHSAATVKFDEALRLSVNMNILGTRRMLNIAKKMVKLEAFVHVSTAYCNCDKNIVDEIVYPPPGDMDRLMMLLECMDDDMLEAMTPKIIKNRPNTYTFTKAMAEHVLVKEGVGLPISIVRPSIVTASLRWPMAGWVDNLNGPTGVLAGAGKGILRTLICYKDLRADIIPVDVCINSIIVVAWTTAAEKHSPIKVYNVTSGVSNPVHWGQLEIWGQKKLVENPYDNVLWYPGGSFKYNKMMNSICVGIFHMLPAYAMDLSSRLMGKKPSMVRIQQKMLKAMQTLEYFTTHEWTFLDSNVQQLHAKLSDTDKKIFDMNIKGIDWYSYTEKYVLGIRRYIFKEQDEDIPSAKQHMRRMYMMHCLTKILLFYAAWRIVIGNSTIARTISYTLVNFVLFTLRRLMNVFRN